MTMESKSQTQGSSGKTHSRMMISSLQKSSFSLSVLATLSAKPSLRIDFREEQYVTQLEVRQPPTG